MKIAVIGLGKIGLPLAVQYARKGHEVAGIDVDPATVASVNRGEEPFPGEAHLGEYLPQVVASGRLTATLDYAEAVPTADVVVLVVPLFVDANGAPDFGIMDGATRSVAVNLTCDTLVIYETTLPVGTTRTRWAPALEGRSGLTAGSDFEVVFSPERVLTGRVFADLRKYPKIVGGLTPEGNKKAVAFYEQVLDFDTRIDLPRGNGVWDIGSAEAAELAKLAETTYRDVNIALANQFALFSQDNGIDVHQVIQAANSQPYSHIHAPGIAVGGHCIPVYPKLYLATDPHATVVRAARTANEHMPERAIARLETHCHNLEGSRIAVLGASYRGEVKETAFSGVFPVIDALKARGAVPLVHDPMYTESELRSLGLAPFAQGMSAEVAVLQADHAEYLNWTRDDIPDVKFILDGRHVLDANLWNPAVMIRLGQPVFPHGATTG